MATSPPQLPNDAAPKKKAYTALTPIDFDNKRYEIGKQLRLDAETAEPLLAAKAIEPAGKEADAT